jgi:addiction module HigA family antidote
MPAQEDTMAEYMTRGRQREPTHPGELMREILEEHVKLPIAEAARRMQISRPALYAVLNGKSAVTADMALRFGKLVGGAPELYLRMQHAHSLWHARKANERVLKAIKTVPLAA